MFCLTLKPLSKPFVVGTCRYSLISLLLRVVFQLSATAVLVHNQIMIYALKGRETWPLEPLRCIPRNRNIVASSYVYLSVSSCMYILIALEDCGSYVYWHNKELKVRFHVSLVSFFLERRLEAQQRGKSNFSSSGSCCQQWKSILTCIFYRFI